MIVSVTTKPQGAFFPEWAEPVGFLFKFTGIKWQRGFLYYLHKLTKNSSVWHYFVTLWPWKKGPTPSKKSFFISMTMRQTSGGAQRNISLLPWQSNKNSSMWHYLVTLAKRQEEDSGNFGTTWISWPLSGYLSTPKNAHTWDLFSKPAKKVLDKSCWTCLIVIINNNNKSYMISSFLNHDWSFHRSKC